MPKRGHRPLHGRRIREAVGVVVDPALEVKAVQPQLPQRILLSQCRAAQHLHPSMGVHARTGIRISPMQRRQHHVDDTAHGLTAKPRACRTLNHLDLLNQAQRNAVQSVGGSQPTEQGNAIDQDQTVHPLHAIQLHTVGPANATPHRLPHSGCEIQGFQEVLCLGDFQRFSRKNRGANGAFVQSHRTQAPDHCCASKFIRRSRQHHRQNSAWATCFTFHFHRIESQGTDVDSTVKLIPRPLSRRIGGAHRTAIQPDRCTRNGHHTVRHTKRARCLTHRHQRATAFQAKPCPPTRHCLQN